MSKLYFRSRKPDETALHMVWRTAIKYDPEGEEYYTGKRRKETRGVGFKQYELQNCVTYICGDRSQNPGLSICIIVRHLPRTFCGVATVAEIAHGWAGRRQEIITY